jgi:hypothetical protein
MNSSGKCTTHTHKGIIYIHKKIKILSFVIWMWMELEKIMLSEISQAQKSKYCMISLVWSLRKLISQKLRVEWWSPEAGREGGRGGERPISGYQIAVSRKKF